MKSKKFVLAGLALLAITGLLALAGCKNDSVPEPTRYTVTFNANGGTFANGGSEVAPQVVESGNAATRPEPDPTKANWVFAGWYTLKDDGETLADTAYSFDTPVEGDITLYAWWLPNPGTVVSNGLTIDEIKLEKTSEVQVLSKEVYLKDLYQAASKSQIFVENRVGSIKPFVMGQYEVTQQLYFAVMGKNPSNFASDVAAEETQVLRPVEQVRWYDAVVFCNELTKKVLGPGACVYYSDAGLTTVYTTGDVTDGKTPYMDISKSGYRLPTEAEWELAARGGDPEEGAWQYTYAGTNEESTLGDYAWYFYEGSDSKTHQVGTKAANSLGLYDMSGNVWEWCWDRWDDGSIDADTPSGRIIRGGGWSSDAHYWAVSRRFYIGPSDRSGDLGFRLVRSSSK